MLSSTNVQTTAHIRKLSTLQIHTYAIGYRCLTVKKIKTSSTHKNQSKWLDDTKKKSNYANQIKQPKAPVCIKQAVCPVKQITQQLKTEFNFLFWNKKKKKKGKNKKQITSSSLSTSSSSSPLSSSSLLAPSPSPTSLVATFSRFYPIPHLVRPPLPPLLPPGYKTA